MATPDDREDDPGRALAWALATMLGVAVVVGLCIGGAMVAVAQVGGLTGDAGGGGRAAAPASLYMPSYVPTKDSGQEGFDLPGPQAMPSALPSDGSATTAPKGDKITLFVAPQNVGPGERINFNGVYTDGEGARLQVQRREGGSWSDFPVEATVRGGSFETWIQTSRSGRTKFRVLDKDANRASNVVTVTIG
ncbi:hypothetical protein [Nocardioides marmoribigeumensis]|uniref:Bacterial spore germination immunoglobulin-like domain-containing protein n=1 Tax=Nocardioides marmoribigeumensis TaxID=433649 RepID=A0ABU2BVI8_9ACTN|nr:hypothetical protein [Nocardioides marmoribigeumensis]MDR7362649.1 hypothetical protein [Nocardioides marmoribigeumensis]